MQICKLAREQEPNGKIGSKSGFFPATCKISALRSKLNYWMCLPSIPLYF
jgi:hypothetical protein